MHWSACRAEGYDFDASLCQSQQTQRTRTMKPNVFRIVGPPYSGVQGWGDTDVRPFLRFVLLQVSPITS